MFGSLKFEHDMSCSVLTHTVPLRHGCQTGHIRFPLFSIVCVLRGLRKVSQKWETSHFRDTGDRTSARPSSGKRYLFEEERGHLRENAIFSSEDVAVFEQTRPFRRSTQPSWRKRDLLGGGRDHPRENVTLSKKRAAIFGKMPFSRRSTRLSSRKCHLLEGGRDHLRENVVFSKEHVTSGFR